MGKKISIDSSNLMNKILELIASYFLDQTITVCKKDEDLALKNKFSKNKIITIHNGIDDLKKKNIYKKKSKEVLKLTMIGRFEQQKDHETLLRACFLLKEYNWELLLIGKGPLENNIKKRVTELSLTKRVTFLGWKKNIVDFLDDTDLFLLISNWEGFPISIIEAMRSGIPIIATDVGGVSESVNHGINGFIIPRGDEKSLATFLKKTFKNRKILIEFGKNSRKIYLEKFHSEKMFKKIERVYLKFTKG